MTWHVSEVMMQLDNMSWNESFFNENPYYFDVGKKHVSLPGTRILFSVEYQAPYESLSIFHRAHDSKYCHFINTEFQRKYT